ncbi:phage holin family protein [Dyadobacter tibetensis]|uniref:phage holin family protein n=1 Tax=Dyadobacter tibetensis TaxID=1211851 RepID=UPI00046E8499|nr:phage holin family protein [Dyadobacter tibetensis]
MMNQLDEIKDTILRYLETRLDLFKIETRGRIEQAIVMVIYGILLYSIFLVALVLGLILLGNYLNEVLDSPYWGYVILLGAALLKLAIWIGFRKWTLGVLSNLIATIMSKKEE